MHRPSFPTVHTKLDCAALATCALLGGINLPARAAQPYVATSDLAVAVINTSGQCTGGVQHIGFSGTTSVPTAACAGATFGITTSANADFGSLRALADVRFNHFDFKPDTTQAYFEAKAEAMSSDTLTFSAGQFWEFTVSVTGQSIYSHDGVGYDENVGWCYNPLGAACGMSGTSVTSFGTYTFKIPIPASHVIVLTPTLTIDITARMQLDGSGSPPPYLPLTSDSYADLSHTARFTGSRVLDANGLPIADATISSASGFDYRNPSPVPEPAAWASLAAGLAVLRMSQRRRVD